MAPDIKPITDNIIERVKAVNICAGGQEIHIRCSRSKVLEKGHVTI